MIIDLTSAETFDRSAEEFDVVIVGAGPVGVYLANLLFRQGKSVLMLEAGGVVVDSANNQVATRVTGRPYLGVELGRTFGLGGTSVVWGGQLARFDPADFRHWPISYSEMEPRYRQVYRDLGVEPETNPQYRARFGKETEGDLVTERIFTHWLPQQNFAKIFAADVTNNPRIPILIKMWACRIEFEDARATRLQARSLCGKSVDVRARRFIFCNGTLEILRFFLSTAASGGMPWSGNPMLGQCFQDHPLGKIATAEVINEQKFRDFFENAIEKHALKIHPKLKVRSEARGADDVGVSAFFSFRSDVQEQLGNIKWLVRSVRSGAGRSNLRTLPRDLIQLFKVFSPLLKRFVSDRRIMAFFDRSVDLMAQVEQRPASSSFVSLNSDAHPIPGLRGIDVNWSLDRVEIVKTLKEFAHHCDKYLQHHGLARLQIDARVESEDPSFVDDMADCYHQAGGMCMADAPEAGVVDRQCKVFGTENVYVAGASVFPSSGHANTTFTALALGARLADSLA
jgi:hypothetical protein